MKEDINLIETFSEFKKFKNIERETLMHILEEIFKHMLLRKYGPNANVSVIVNVDKGDVEFQRWLEIVEDGEVEDPSTQIALSDAVKIEPDFEVGEDLCEKISLEDFGRRDILSLRQNLAAKIMEYEKEVIYQKYSKRIGEIVSGTVHQAWKKEILLQDEDGIELVLPKSEQIPGDFYKKGDSIRAVVLKVEMGANSTIITASRTSPMFLERLMEEEIPEIYDGLITIKNIVRVPGERAKIAVETYDDRIDPVGSCIGMKGSRIHGIVRELRNENLDVITYTNNPVLYIQRALSPARISSIVLNEEEKTATAYLAKDQVSFAIGRGGCNIKLANKLTGYDIEVIREGSENENDEDVELGEFKDEIDEWILNELRKVGCNTAKNVLEMSKDVLLHSTEREEETIDEVLRILRSEFEN